MSTLHLALPHKLDGRVSKNWIVVEQIRPGVFAKTNSTHRYKRSDFAQVQDADVVETIGRLLIEVKTCRNVIAQIGNKDSK